ncbi:MAG: hypothetical protein ACREQQ_07695 [Candidatus Binatia bacterium]
MPVAMTAVAAALGYAFAVYPIWNHMGKMHRIETLGPLISADEADRRALLGAYFEDSGLDVGSFENVAWSVRTVMTPFVGYAPAPGQHHNAYIDSHQFRGRRKLETPKPPGMIRIFLTGASTAFSVGASSDERTIGGYLQSVLDRRGAEAGKRYEVFTFATPSWSSTHERIAIENRLSDLEPDLVVELTGTADCLYGQHGRNVLWSRAFTDNYYFELVNIVLKRTGFKTMANVQDVAKRPLPPDTVARGLEKNVRLAASALAPARARLHVFLQPAAFTSGKPLTRREAGMRPTGDWLKFSDPNYYQECSRAIGARLTEGVLPPNAEFTDLTTLFDQVPATQEIFVDSFHFGDRGNLAIAEAMAKAILR